MEMSLWNAKKAQDVRGPDILQRVQNESPFYIDDDLCINQHNSIQ